MYGDAHKQLVNSGDWREHIDLHTHRYVTEDTELGLAFLASVARWCGVDAPIAHGLLAVTGAFLGRDLRTVRAPSRRSAWPTRPRRAAAAAARRRIDPMTSGADTTMPRAPAAVGAGRMGRGIAIAFAYAGHRIALIDSRRRERAAGGAPARRGLRRDPHQPRRPRRSSARWTRRQSTAIAARVAVGRRRAMRRRARRRRAGLRGRARDARGQARGARRDRPPCPRRRGRDLDDEQHPRHPARAADPVPSASSTCTG